MLLCLAVSKTNTPAQMKTTTFPLSTKEEGWLAVFTKCQNRLLGGIQRRLLGGIQRREVYHGADCDFLLSHPHSLLTRSFLSFALAFARHESAFRTHE